MFEGEDYGEGKVLGAPQFEFGWGLSYTSFSYSDLHVAAGTASGSQTVRVDVTNTGARTGDEVVQLYVQHLGSAVERPNKDLRGYRRITLNAGETRTVELSLRASSLAYWNPATHGWVVETEPVRIQVGTSSADLRLDTRIRVVGAR